MRGVDSIGKIKPYMFSFFFFEKKKRGQASSSRLGLFLPFGGDLRCGADIFLFQKIGEFFFYGEYYLRY